MRMSSWRRNAPQKLNLVTAKTPLSIDLMGASPITIEE
jgi:hypothetical protein